jgi:glycerol-3-phosphate acyltransferase PlsY
VTGAIPASPVPVLLCGVAYLLGSIPTSVWVGKLVYGVDIRSAGSGNAGGTNTLRVLGWRAALPVIVVDVGKGAAAALLPRLAAPGQEPWLPAACVAAAVVGHCFPVLASFRGGKGVAAAAGGLCVLAPWQALACAGVWLAVLAVRRTVSLASLVAAFLLPIAVVLLPVSTPPGLLELSTGLALLVAWTHRSNVRRLAKGTEPRLAVGGRAPRS